jgi:hypothetical protein
VIGIETFAHDPLSDPGYHPIESSRAKSAVEDRDEYRSLGKRESSGVRFRLRSLLRSDAARYR